MNKTEASSASHSPSSVRRRKHRSNTRSEHGGGLPVDLSLQTLAENSTLKLSSPKHGSSSLSGAGTNLLHVLPFEVLLHILSFLGPSSLCAIAQASRKLRRTADSNFLWRSVSEGHFGLPPSEWSKYGSPQSPHMRLKISEFQHTVFQAISTFASRTPGFLELLSTFRNNPDETTIGADFLPEISHLTDEIALRYEKPVEEWRRQSEEEFATSRDWKAHYRQCYQILVDKNRFYFLPAGLLSGAHRDAIWCMRPKGNNSDLVFTGDEDGTIVVWDLEHKDPLRVLRNSHRGAVYDIVPLPQPHDEGLILSGGADGNIILCDWTKVQSGTVVRTMSVAHKDSVSSLSFCCDRRWVLSAGADDTMLVHDIDSGQLVWKIDEQRSGGINVARFVDRKYVVSVGMDAVIRVWKLNSKKPPRQVRSMKGHTNLVTSITTWKQRDGSVMIISGSYDGTVRCWDLKSGHCLRTMSGHDGGVESISLIHLERPLLVVLSRYRVIRVWNVANGELVKTIPAFDTPRAKVFSSGPLSILIIRDMILSTCDELPSIKIWRPRDLGDTRVGRASPRPHLFS